MVPYTGNGWRQRAQAALGGGVLRRHASTPPRTLRPSQAAAEPPDGDGERKPSSAVEFLGVTPRPHRAPDGRLKPRL